MASFFIGGAHGITLTRFEQAGAISGIALLMWWVLIEGGRRVFMRLRNSMRSRQIWPPFLAPLVLLAPPLSAFKPQYHAKITEDALKHVTRTIEGHSLQFTPRAIEEIVAANVGQDNGWEPCVIGGSPRSPFADSRNHFDSERLADAASLLRGRLNEARGKLKLNNPLGRDARKLLGQVLHALQDYGNLHDHRGSELREYRQYLRGGHEPIGAVANV